MIWRDLNLTQSCQFVDVKKTDVFTVTLCLSNLFRSAFVMETSSEEVLSFQDKSSAKKNSEKPRDGPPKNLSSYWTYSHFKLQKSEMSCSQITHILSRQSYYQVHWHGTTGYSSCDVMDLVTSCILWRHRIATKSASFYYFLYCQRSAT